MRGADKVPVIELSAEGYQHPDRSIGYVAVPNLKLVDWIDGESVATPDTF
jgi:hypothetical protein